MVRKIGTGPRFAQTTARTILTQTSFAAGNPETPTIVPSSSTHCAVTLELDGLGIYVALQNAQASTNHHTPPSFKHQAIL